MLSGSSIHISLPDLPNHDPHTRFEVFPALGKVIERWFERSGTCSLAVSLLDSNHYESDPDNHPIPLLLSVCHRLRHLALIAETKVLLPLLCLGPEDLPILKSLRVYIRDPVAFTDHQDATILQISSLTDISLRVMTIPLLLPLKWSQLTGLALVCYPVWTSNGCEGGLDGVRVLEVLRRCPNLLRCELRITRDRDDPGLTSNTTLITLPHLHTLILRGSCRFPTWIPHLAIPRLRCLQVGERGYTGRFTNNPVQDTHMRAENDTSCFTSHSLLDLLQACPTISHLHLFASYSDIFLLDETFLAHFAPPQQC
jgi:hypothetical protein